MNQENYYQILGVSEKATGEQIRQAYRSLCKDLHPDKLPHDSGDNLKNLAEQRIKMITIAYSTLKDEKLRREYDLKHLNCLSSEEPVNTSSETVTYEELLSDLILEQGLNDLIIEEEEAYNNFCNEVKIIQEHYTDYLSETLNSDISDFYPDNLTFRINKFLKIFYLYLPSLFIILTLFWVFCTVVAFVCDLILIFLFGEPLLMYIVGAAIYLVPILTFLILLSIIFSGFNNQHENSKDKQGTYYTFSGDFKNFHEKFMDFGWDIKLLHFFKPLYKDNYVSAIRKKTDEFKKQFEGLHSSRKSLIDKFKSVSSYTLQNPSYIENLSYAERFLLIKALEEKLQEEKDKESRSNALKVAGAVGLVALFVASGGNIGP